MFHRWASCSGVVLLAHAELCTELTLTLHLRLSRNGSSDLAMFSDVHVPMISLVRTLGLTRLRMFPLSPVIPDSPLE